MWAVVNGAFDLGRANEWIVTIKAGSSNENSSSLQAIYKSCRAYATETIMGAFIIAAAFYGVLWANRYSFSIFLTLQGLTFIAFGFNMVDAGALLGRPITWNHRKSATKTEEKESLITQAM